jgi:MHS family proline/betaine transporter-like MFS transporter
VEARYRGIAINYSLGAGIFGFATPISLLFLLETTGNLNVPVFFVTGCAIFFIIALINLGQADNKVKKFDDFRSYSRK